MQLHCFQRFQFLVAAFFFACALCGMSSCTTTNDVVSHGPSDEFAGHGGSKNDSSSKPEKNDTTEIDPSEITVDDLFMEFDDNLDFEEIPSVTFTRGSAKYKISAFYILSTEVTQKLYKTIMGSLPKQDKDSSFFPVVNVSWYDAALFCNALAKKVGLDTAYVYNSVGDGNYLKNLKVNYSIASVRLPTETEWEVAAHGTSFTTRFYWGDDVASDYAYYGQSKGPRSVGGLKPNAYNLYDMAGNVAEWVNDWYSSYSTVSQENPTGKETGNTKCVRGGGWPDKVADIAPNERDKKDPLYQGLALGFRIVYSDGF